MKDSVDDGQELVLAPERARSLEVSLQRSKKEDIKLDLSDDGSLSSGEAPTGKFKDENGSVSKTPKNRTKLLLIGGMLVVAIMAIAALALNGKDKESNESVSSSGLCVPQVQQLKDTMLSFTIEGVNRTLTETEKEDIEHALVRGYNEVSGQCDDIYERWMYQSWITAQELVEEEDETYLRLNVASTVSCNECPSAEAFASIFEEAAEEVLDDRRRNRKLKESVNAVDVMKSVEEYVLERVPDAYRIPYFEIYSDGKDYVMNVDDKYCDRKLAGDFDYILNGDKSPSSSKGSKSASGYKSDKSPNGTKSPSNSKGSKSASSYKSDKSPSGSKSSKSSKSSHKKYTTNVCPSGHKRSSSKSSKKSSKDDSKDDSTHKPTHPPTHPPTNAPSGAPSNAPSGAPSSGPSGDPSSAPSGAPSSAPTRTHPFRNPGGVEQCLVLRTTINITGPPGPVPFTPANQFLPSNLGYSVPECDLCPVASQCIRTCCQNCTAAVFLTCGASCASDFAACTPTKEDKMDAYKCLVDNGVIIGPWWFHRDTPGSVYSFTEANGGSNGSSGAGCSRITADRVTVPAGFPSAYQPKAEFEYWSQDFHGTLVADFTSFSVDYNLIRPRDPLIGTPRNDYWVTIYLRTTAAFTGFYECRFTYRLEATAPPAGSYPTGWQTLTILPDTVAEPFNRGGTAGCGGADTLAEFVTYAKGLTGSPDAVFGVGTFHEFETWNLNLGDTAQNNRGAEICWDNVSIRTATQEFVYDFEVGSNEEFGIGP